MTGDGALSPFEEIVPEDQEKQALSPKPPQDPIEERACGEGIRVPLDLPEFRLIAQELDAWITQAREHGPDPMRQALSACTNTDPHLLCDSREIKQGRRST